jgi:hypothetical protein
MSIFDNPCKGHERGFHSTYLTVNGYDQDIRSCRTCYYEESA